MNVMERTRGRPQTNPPEVCPHCLRPMDPKAVSRPVIAGDLVVDLERQSVTWKGKPIDVTRMECAILATMAAKPGVLRSRGQIIESCWADYSDVDDRLVDCHIKRLRRRFLKVDPDFSMIEAVYGSGYRWRRS